MSKAKAKIAAAKAAAEAKTAERGYVVPEAQETQGISLPGGGNGGVKLSREEKYLAEAKAVREKRIALTGEDGEKKVSKSQSALVNQYKTMEKKLKAQARAAREEDAALKAKQDDMAKPSIELPGGIKIGF